MRKFLISAAILSVVAAAAPASAQYRGNGYGHRSDDRIDHQINQIEDRIKRAAYNRQISRSEANRLLRQADRLDRLEDRYSRNGLTRWEVQDLRQRLNHLRQQIRFERRDDRYYR